MVGSSSFHLNQGCPPCSPLGKHHPILRSQGGSEVASASRAGHRSSSGPSAGNVLAAGAQPWMAPSTGNKTALSCWGAQLWRVTLEWSLTPLRSIKCPPGCYGVTLFHPPTLPPRSKHSSKGWLWSRPTCQWLQLDQGTVRACGHHTEVAEGPFDSFHDVLSGRGLYWNYLLCEQTSHIPGSYSLLPIDSGWPTVQEEVTSLC